MTKQITDYVTLRDAFGTQVNIGDLIMGATPRKSYYLDTSYSFGIVIGRTKGMLRIHKLGEHPDAIKLSRTEILKKIQTRRGNPGGKVLSVSLINLQKPTGLTEDEISKALEEGIPKVSTLNDNPFPF